MSTSLSAWAAEARTRSLPSGSSPAPIATAVCEALCGSIPIITVTMHMLQNIIQRAGNRGGHA